MNASSSANSFVGQFNPRSPRQAWRVAGSSRSSPTSSTAGRSFWPRRTSARSRADSSANENGFVR